MKAVVKFVIVLIGIGGMLYIFVASKNNVPPETEALVLEENTPDRSDDNAPQFKEETPLPAGNASPAVLESPELKGVDCHLPEIDRVKGDPAMMRLPLEEQRSILRKRFVPLENHASIIDELNENDKQLFRQVNREAKKALRIQTMNSSIGFPLTVMGPVLIKTMPDHPVYLRAIDNGCFINSRPEIYVRTDKDGIARVDFRLGIDPGVYRILATVAGLGTTRITYRCVKEKKGEDDEKKEI